jgi:hypothetical protein
MADTPGADQGVEGFDPDVDRYPSLIDVLTALVQDDSIPDVPIERLELTALASGEASYRYWRARAEESEGGYFSQV